MKKTTTKKATRAADTNALSSKAAKPKGKSDGAALKKPEAAKPDAKAAKKPAGDDAPVITGSQADYDAALSAALALNAKSVLPFRADASLIFTTTPRL